MNRPAFISFIAALIILTGCGRYVPPEGILQQTEADRAVYVVGEEPFFEVIWFGNVNLWMTDGEESLLSDGWVSRYDVFRMLICSIGPKREALEKNIAHLRKATDPLRLENLQAVMVGHAHYDHILDAPHWAVSPEVLGEGVENVPILGAEDMEPILAAYQPRPPEILVSEADGTRFPGKPDGAFRTANFVVRPIPIDHGKGCSFLQRISHERLHGPASDDFSLPAKARAFRSEQTLAFHIHHRPTDSRILIYGSSGLPQVDIRDYPADVLYVSVALLSDQGDGHREAFYEKVIKASGAKVIVQVHWDDLFREPGDSPKVMRQIASDIRAAMAYLWQRLEAIEEEERPTMVWPTMWEPMRVESFNAEVSG